MKRTWFALLAILALGMVLWAGWHYGYLSDLAAMVRPGTEPPGGMGVDAEEPFEGRVVALGRLEPAGGLIDIAAVPGDRIRSIEVEEGKPVSEGQTLALLDSRELRELEWKALSAQLAEAQSRASAEARLADARITAAGVALKKAQTSNLDIRAQTEKRDVARANLELASKDQARLAGLREGLVTDQEHERQDLLVQQAAAELAAAEAMLEKLVKTRPLAIEAAQADLAAAEATKEQVLSAIPVESLKQQRDLAKARFERTEIKAPCAGTVLKVFMREGETIGQRPVLQMGDLERMVVVAEVFETDAKRVKPGQAAVVTSDAFLEPHDKEGLRGEVASVAPMITNPALKSLDPMAPADRRVVEVRIALDEECSARAAHLTNLEVDVEIDVD